MLSRLAADFLICKTTFADVGFTILGVTELRMFAYPVVNNNRTGVGGCVEVSRMEGGLIDERLVAAGGEGVVVASAV